MKKIVRNLATHESRELWTRAEQASAEVSGWPAWKRAGINVAQVRSEVRSSPDLLLAPESSLRPR
jgi:hypothetical protein